MSLPPKFFDPKSTLTEATEPTALDSEASELASDPVDLTDQLPPLEAHTAMSIPQQDVTLTFTGEQVEFILDTLYNTHINLVASIRDTKVSQEDRQLAYSYALLAEKMYAAIFDQLKIKRVERDDLH